MTKTSLVLLSIALGATVSCGSPEAQLTDDAAPDLEIEERVAELREEATRFEGRRVLERDADAMARIQDWLAEMEDADDEEAALYERAVRAQLEFLRVTELLYYPEQAGRP